MKQSVNLMTEDNEIKLVRVNSKLIFKEKMMKSFEIKALLASFIIVLVIRTLLRLVNSNWLADGNFLILVVVPVLVLMLVFNLVKLIWTRWG